MKVSTSLSVLATMMATASFTKTTTSFAFAPADGAPPRPTACFTHSSSTTRLNSRSSVDFCNQIDYVEDIQELSELMADVMRRLEQVHDLTLSLQELERQDITLADLGNSPKARHLRHAVAEAKVACDTHGADSKQARLAWKDVDQAAKDYSSEHAPSITSTVSTDMEDPLHHGPISNSYQHSAAALLKNHKYEDVVVDEKVLADTQKAIAQLEAFAHYVNVERGRLQASNDQLAP